MMFPYYNAEQNSGIFSMAMQRRMDMMLQNADSLFSLGCLRKRLWKDFAIRVGKVPAT